MIELLTKEVGLQNYTSNIQNSQEEETAVNVFGYRKMRYKNT